jgi:UDP-N-acetylglucosamine transferase subunit ALG13
MDRSLWVTFDSPQSRSLLAGRSVEYVRYSPSRDGKSTLTNMAAATRILSRDHFDVAVSTGATVAVSFLPVAHTLGIPSYYIESAARTSGPSLTGRLLQLVPGVRLYTQHRRFANRRWTYAGSVFDAFAATPLPQPKPISRIVVTVGASETYGFSRLFQALARILPTSIEVLWQTGCADVHTLGIPGRRQVAAAELQAAMAAADVVVAHAGVGSALSALEAGKVPVLVPREVAHHEHVDDHQFQIAADLGARGLAVVRRVEELTFADLVGAANQRVERATAPAPLELEWCGRGRSRWARRRD